MVRYRENKESPWRDAAQGERLGDDSQPSRAGWARLYCCCDLCL
jgi:hypothetical protein